ncbi:hypothetical protein EJ08DRAFT_272364 [Tothia fuscella]|uniref:Xylanolytic transcriptional activator regulatory domain-containing protein n=1 Tax=Tothia fuscella TaxID=1048955 RepID=A0A9P4NPI0_9PEZI|nr:hypothetical protein EJ08DRAFT_272364 [Tothia fuscella]
MIGCRFSRIAASSQLAQAISELVKLSFFQLIDVDENCVRTSWSTTAMLLDQVGMMYNGSRRHLFFAPALLVSGVTTSVRRNNYLRQSEHSFHINETTNGNALHASWLKWAHEESCRKLGFGCWILQSQLPVNFQIPGSMRLTELRQGLPCADELWEASTAEEWRSIYLHRRRSSYMRPMDMNSALQMLTSSGGLTDDVEGFGRLAVVYAIYSIVFELRTVQNHIFDILTSESESHSISTANLQDRLAQVFEILRPLCEHSDALYKTPTKSAKDLQSTVFTTAHHVSLRNFAPVGDLLAFTSAPDDDSEKLQAEHRLLVWSADDNGRTARRAVLHACSLFTSIRNQSCGSFYEPVAFLVATLTIWTYNYLVREPGNNAVPLDNVWGTEYARIWLEDCSHGVCGSLSDVGSINHPRAGKVLLEIAHKSLLQMTSWATSQEFALFIDRLQRKFR